MKSYLQNLFYLGLFFSHRLAFAESTEKNFVKEPMAQDFLWRLSLGLLAVLGLLMLTAWGAKRVWRLPGKQIGHLRLLGGLALGQRERVVLIQVGRERLLLGVAPGVIKKLHLLNADEDPLLAETAPSDEIALEIADSQNKSFAAKLAGLLRQNKKC